jgi:hypothetical protein
MLKSEQSGEKDTELQLSLERFVIGNAELDRLEGLLGEVNFFEAAGADRAEKNHSDFLAFLLDPAQAHGLKDYFLKRFLQQSVRSDLMGRTGVTPIEIELWDLSDSIVRRESDNIDILITNERVGLSVIVENKIESEEHDDQLTRYRLLISRRYPGINLICLFLTVDGSQPTDDHYIALSHASVCSLIEEFLATRRSDVAGDVVVMLRHYSQLLRRYFMEESELGTLAKRIYEKHRRAIDFIVAQRPDQQAAIAEILQDLVKTSPTLMLDYSTKGATGFVPKEWDQFPLLLTSIDDWSSSRRLLLFWFDNSTGRLTLKLTIGPGDETVRNRLFEASKNDDLFNAGYVKLYATTTIWVKPFLKRGYLEEFDTDQIRQRITALWEEFSHMELPKIRTRICEILSKP